MVLIEYMVRWWFNFVMIVRLLQWTHSCTCCEEFDTVWLCVCPNKRGVLISKWKSNYKLNGVITSLSYRIISGGGNGDVLIYIYTKYIAIHIKYYNILPKYFGGGAWQRRAIQESFLHENCIFHQSAKVFSTKIVSFTNLRKFSPSKVSGYTVPGEKHVPR